MYNRWQLAILTIVLLTTLRSDLKYQLIPNSITLPAIALGLLLNLFSEGVPGLINSISGAVLGLALFIIPFIIGGLGGGDVKLIMAIGAIMGIRFSYECIFYIVMAGAAISLIIILIQGKLRQSMKKMSRYFISTILLQKIINIEEKEIHTTFPYGVAIFLGAAITLLRNWRFY